MRILDERIYRDFQKVAEMGSTVKRVAESIDNGVLDKRIKMAVIAGFKKGKEDRIGCCQLCD